MPRAKRAKKKKRARPYKHDAKKHARRRYARRHPKSKINHQRRIRKEVESLNYLLHQLLKTASAEPEDPYQYHPRHHTKDPEFKFSNPRTQEFKKGHPATDTHFWSPQGDDLPPHIGNFRELPQDPPYWMGPHVAVV